jgi:hypothetical protein
VAAPFLFGDRAQLQRRASLPTVLAALHNQTFRDFEMIVIDDASSDARWRWSNATLS